MNKNMQQANTKTPVMGYNNCTMQTRSKNEIYLPCPDCGGGPPTARARLGATRYLQCSACAHKFVTEVTTTVLDNGSLVTMERVVEKYHTMRGRPRPRREQLAVAA